MADNFDNKDVVTSDDDMGAYDPSTSDTPNSFYDKSQSLVDIANNTFKELCRTLESEQNKLLELENRRQKLQEEMQRPKKEIEDEKQSYRLNLMESVSENLEAINGISGEDGDDVEIDAESLDDFIARNEGSFGTRLETCYEVDESAVDEVVEMDIGTETNLIEESENIENMNFLGAIAEDGEPKISKEEI